VVFWGAGYLRDPRKGFGKFLEALKELSRSIEKPDEVFIYIAGNADEESRRMHIPFKHRYAGTLSIDQIIEAYQLSHVYACTSVEDSGPTMINQAILCGTPVAAFEMGVSLDLVHDSKTGYRVALGDIQAFASGLQKILSADDRQYAEMAGNCRNEGLSKLDPKNQIKQYQDIFRKLNLPDL
jgi:glycosyltransferase involved in cell wall biosynthesis